MGTDTRYVNPAVDRRERARQSVREAITAEALRQLALELAGRRPSSIIRLPRNATIEDVRRLVASDPGPLKAVPA